MGRDVWVVVVFETTPPGLDEVLSGVRDAWEAMPGTDKEVVVVVDVLVFCVAVWRTVVAVVNVVIGIEAICVAEGRCVVEMGRGVEDGKGARLWGGGWLDV